MTTTPVPDVATQLVGDTGLDKPNVDVVVSGIGTMGKLIMTAVERATDMNLIGALNHDTHGQSCIVVEGHEVPLNKSLDVLSKWQPDVVVDFSHPEWTTQLLPVALLNRIRFVVGTSGLDPDFVQDVKRQAINLTHGGRRVSGGCIISNFSVGAVSMMHVAKLLARRFTSVEIIEKHHDGKADAPSGTAMATARLINEHKDASFSRHETQRHNVEGQDSRNAKVGGITIHSVRLPGMVAHHEIIFGRTGETLTLRHDMVSRESLLAPILDAIRDTKTARTVFTDTDLVLARL